MSAHSLPINMSRALREGFFRVPDPGAIVGTISWSNKGLAIVHVTTAAAESRALASASNFASGTRCMVILQKQAGALTITGAASNVVLFNNGDTAIFVVTNSNGTLVWRLETNTAVSGSASQSALGRGMEVATITAMADTATVTAAQLLTKILEGVPTSAATYTLPTAALLVAAIPGAQVGDTFRFTIDNKSAGANTITVAAGANGTARGTLTVAQNVSRQFLVSLTNVTLSSETYVVKGF